MDSNLFKRNHSFPYLWAPRRCILDACSKIMRYSSVSDRRSSGERKISGEIDVVFEANEISIPLAHAVISLDDEALVFTISVPPNVAKHSEFKFRCADSAELRKWHSALVVVCDPETPSSSVAAAESAVRTLKLGSSSADFSLSDSGDLDFKSRSLPTKYDVRSATIGNFIRAHASSGVLQSRDSSHAAKVDIGCRGNGRDG
jgi:hypothetical protein